MLPDSTLVRGGIGARAIKIVALGFSSPLFALSLGGALVTHHEVAWGTGIALFFAIGTCFFLPPVFRIGSFTLSARELTFRPIVGKSKTIPLESIRGEIHVDVDTATLRLDEPALTMSGVSNLEALWGALLVMPPLARLLTQPVVGEPAFAEGLRFFDAVDESARKGIIVMRRRYAAFVPLSFPTSNAGLARDIALSVLLMPVGIGISRTHPTPPVHLILQHASAVGSRYFDAVCEALTSKLGGVSCGTHADCMSLADPHQTREVTALSFMIGLRRHTARLPTALAQDVWQHACTWGHARPHAG